MCWADQSFFFLGGTSSILKTFRAGPVKKNTLYTYLIFVIFFTQAKFLENEIYTEKRVNYDKLNSKLPILSLKIFTSQKKFTRAPPVVLQNSKLQRLPAEKNQWWPYLGCAWIGLFLASSAIFYSRYLYVTQPLLKRWKLPIISASAVSLPAHKSLIWS